jgi:6-phosphogluconolactonase (cycloisomerase 2 family)
MKRQLALATLASLAAALVPVQAAYPGDRAAHGAAAADVVFVQTNEPAGNRIVVFDRGGDGRLTRAGTYPTGGRGGVAAPGTESDHLASQSSLVYDGARGLLFAVNAGSDTVSTFEVAGDVLSLTDVTASGGGFPASIAVHDNVVYVLDAGGTGTLQGFRIAGDKLQAIPHSTRTLGLANTDPPAFLTSPGQVGFTPDGRQLIVTTKASGSTIDVFAVDPNGRLSGTPVRNPSATPVPFAFTFTPAGRLAMGEAGASSLTTYALGADGTVADPKSQSDGQVALCWVQRVGRYYFVSNTGSNTLSGFEVSAEGQPSLVTPTGVVATTDAGPIDLTSPSGTRFLYAQTGLAGTVDEFLVNDDGTLTRLGAVTGLPPGMEGIAST